MDKKVDFINEWKNRIHGLRKIAKRVGDKA